MSKNPLMNALLAAGYIGLVASIIFYAPQKFDSVGGPLAIVTFLSLFVLSAAVMGFLFLYQPLQLLVEGNKKEALSLFLRTLGAFATITVLFFAILFALFA